MNAVATRFSASPKRYKPPNSGRFWAAACDELTQLNNFVAKNRLATQFLLANFLIVPTWLSDNASALAREAAQHGVQSAAPTQNESNAARSPLENFHRLTPALFSGGEPKDAADFSTLAQMGVRTVVSVDGIEPKVAAAAKHGLRYVHIPIGYDAVDPQAQLALTRLVREVKGPIYIHCHHGKHRGPAAAAVACMAAGAMTHEQATEFLKTAGTGREYVGLWRDVAEFAALPADAELPPLVETVKVDSLAATMAQLDRAWDGLRLCHAAGWETPVNHADLSPEHQALLVWEGLRESKRTNPYADEQLAEWLRTATRQAEQLHQSLKADRPDAASASFRQLEARCAQCHKQYRN